MADHRFTLCECARGKGIAVPIDQNDVLLRQCRPYWQVVRGSDNLNRFPLSGVSGCTAIEQIGDPAGENRRDQER